MDLIKKKLDIYIYIMYRYIYINNIYIYINNIYIYIYILEYMNITSGIHLGSFVSESSGQKHI